MINLPISGNITEGYGRRGGVERRGDGEGRGREGEGEIVRGVARDIYRKW